MTTQVIFTMDKRLKERAMRRAKADGVPFSSVLKQAVKDYVEGSLELRLMKVDPPFNAKTAKLMRKAIADIEKGKNLSPQFHTVKEVRAYLESA